MTISKRWKGLKRIKRGSSCIGVSIEQHDAGGEKQHACHGGCRSLSSSNDIQH
jgi:hypothetical protein